MSEVHAQAQTTPRTRAEIKESSSTLVGLAKTYNISVATARKWKASEHRPRMGTSADFGQLVLNQCSRRLSLEACDTQNLGNNLAHALGFPIRQSVPPFLQRSPA